MAKTATVDLTTGRVTVVETPAELLRDGVPTAETLARLGLA